MNTKKYEIKISKLSKENPAKSKQLKHLFEIDTENNNNKHNKTKIQIKYNETVFFVPSINKSDESNFESKTNTINKMQSEDKDLSKIINNVLNTAMKSTDNSIKLNLNINNNYYHSNYNYVVNGNNSKYQDQQDSSKSAKKTFFGMFNNKLGDHNLENYKNPKFNEMVLRTINVIDPRSSASSMQSLETNESRKLPNNTSNCIFIPCINCNNLIHIEQVENHSDYCTKVKEEVIVAESSQFSYHTIDLKLRKLRDHINFLKNTDGTINLTNSNSGSHKPVFDFQKDGHYISLLLQYIEDSVNLCKIGHKSITELKKLLTNIDTLIHTYKGTISTLVLIERTRVLLSEKFMVFKEDYKKSFNTKKMNEKKSGALNKIKLQKLEKEKEEKLILAEKLEIEKSMMLRKVNNLKKTSTSNKSTPYSKNSSNDHNELINLDLGNEEGEDKYQRIDAKNFYNDRNVIENIDSELENNSVISAEYSDCTSISGFSNLSLNKEGARNSDPLGRGITELFSPINKNGINSFSFVSYNNISDVPLPNSKQLYQEFVKMMLQVKFEKIHSAHKGQQIPDKILFRECIQKNIPQIEWKDFIISQLQQPEKYNKYFKRDNKLKDYKPYINNMEVIKEEN